MAGFAVVFRKDNRPPSSEIYEDMRRSLRIFGPDKDNIVTAGRFTLIWAYDTGYTPQDILESQPVSAEGRWHLVFVGFLMHREELAQKLCISAPVSEKTSDSAMVMMAWQKWGEECLGHIYGTYSFIVCDTRQQKIFAIRGQERGINIFYHENDERIVFATSTKPMFCDPDIPKEIDEVRIADALVLNFEDRERSYFKNINIVPGGHIMRANPDGLDIRRYYRLANSPDIRFAKDSDYVEAANELFGNAVASSMRANQTPTISLSSGLDSPAVAITMLNQISANTVPHKAPVKAFTSVPAKFWDGRTRNRWEGDESAPVRALAKKYPDLEVEFLDSEHLPFDHGLDHIQSYADVPLRGVGNLHWGLDISQQCRRLGKRVNLTGSSGNAALSMSMESTIFGAWFRQGRWVHLLREHHKLSRKTPITHSNYFKKLLGRALLPNMPDWLYNLYVGSGRGSANAGFETFSAINPAYARDMNSADRMSQFGWDDRYRKPGTRKELMELMSERGGRDEAGALQEPFKIMTGVQSRDPMGDRKILEFCYGIPDDQFYKDGVDRRLIKRMMDQRLPPEIVQAPRGEQSADWHGRIKKDLKRIDAELDRLADDPVMAERLDIVRMRKQIQNWPDKTPVSFADSPDFAFARYAVGRGIAVARFINHVEGKN